MATIAENRDSAESQNRKKNSRQKNGKGVGKVGAESYGSSELQAGDAMEG